MRVAAITLCVLFAIAQTNDAFAPMNSVSGRRGVQGKSASIRQKAFAVTAVKSIRDGDGNMTEQPKLSLQERIRNKLRFRKQIRHMAVVVITALAFRTGTPQIAHAKGAVATPVKESESSMKGLPTFATVTIAAGAGTAVAATIRRTSDDHEIVAKPAETGLMKALVATQADKETSDAVTEKMDENERLKTKEVVEKMLERAEQAYKVSNIVKEEATAPVEITPAPVVATVPAPAPVAVTIAAPQPAPQPVQQPQVAREVRTHDIAAAAAKQKSLDRIPPKAKIAPKPKPAPQKMLGLQTAEHYATMPLEERAFNILVDLGMVEINPDPADPKYDSSKDHLFVGE
mmetsp:Transcript_10581/g.16296  ORF Transcript_10581/g.16296 Transcript_10581/m.16296 type:complete len:345 (+) Transcript_10581:103-1137(+)